MSEFVRIRKDELDALRKDVEAFVQHYEASSRKVKDLTKENASLREQIRTAAERLAVADQKISAEVQQTEKTTAVIQALRANISRSIQETERELKG